MVPNTTKTWIIKSSLSKASLLELLKLFLSKKPLRLIKSKKIVFLKVPSLHPLPYRVPTNGCEYRLPIPRDPAANFFYFGFRPSWSVKLASTQTFWQPLTSDNPDIEIFPSEVFRHKPPELLPRADFLAFQSDTQDKLADLLHFKNTKTNRATTVSQIMSPTFVLKHEFKLFRQHTEFLFQQLTKRIVRLESHLAISPLHDVLDDDDAPADQDDDIRISHTIITSSSSNKNDHLHHHHLPPHNDGLPPAPASPHLTKQPDLLPDDNHDENDDQKQQQPQGIITQITSTKD